MCPWKGDDVPPGLTIRGRENLPLLLGAGYFRYTKRYTRFTGSVTPFAGTPCRLLMNPLVVERGSEEYKIADNPRKTCRRTGSVCIYI
jgi:hypothetical protein